MKRSSDGDNRRLVTVVVANLDVVPDLDEEFDPESLPYALASSFEVFGKHIRQYNGRLRNLSHESAAGFFGAPRAHEHEAERAIRAAFDYMAELVRLNDELERSHHLHVTARLGIQTAEVVGGRLSEDIPAAYSVLGEPVVSARKLASLAAPGELLVGGLTRQLVRARVLLEPVVLPSGTTPLAAYRAAWLGTTDGRLATEQWALEDSNL